MARIVRLQPGSPALAREPSEVFIYDLAVSFVPADNDGTHALAFCRSLGGVPTATGIFTFSDDHD